MKLNSETFPQEPNIQLRNDLDYAQILSCYFSEFFFFFFSQQFLMLSQKEMFIFVVECIFKEKMN